MGAGQWSAEIGANKTAFYRLLRDAYFPMQVIDDEEHIVKTPVFYSNSITRIYQS